MTEAPATPTPAPAEATPTSPTAGPTGATGPTESFVSGATGATGAPVGATGATGPVGAPEKYGDFTAPEGLTLDKAQIEAISPIFKELNLTQEQAQKLVDFQASREGTLAKAGREAYDAMRTGWRDEVAREYGTRLPQVRAEVGRALDLLPADVRQNFAKVMDQTGVGDNPAFIKAFHTLAQKLNEGRPVAPGAPAPVTAPNGRPASAAGAIYPNLPQ